MQACRTSVPEHQQDDKSSDGKVRHVLLAMYCLWTSNKVQHTNAFGHLWRPTTEWAPPPLTTPTTERQTELNGENPQIQGAIVCHLITTAILFISQNEANKHFTLIRWLNHPVVQTSRKAKHDKNGHNWPK